MGGGGGFELKIHKKTRKFTLPKSYRLIFQNVYVECRIIKAFSIFISLFEETWYSYNF